MSSSPLVREQPSFRCTNIAHTGLEGREDEMSKGLARQWVRNNNNASPPKLPPIAHGTWSALVPLRFMFMCRDEGSDLSASPLC